MSIAVIMPAFNVAPYIGTALASVIGQTYRDWRLIVVDDGSTDETAAIVRTFSDGRITLIRQHNRGVSVARNAGLRLVKADSVLFLDADDLLVPGALSSLNAGLAVAPGAVGVVGAYSQITMDGIVRGGVRSFGAEPAVSQLLILNMFANGGHILVRSTAIEQVGDFNESLAFGEDWEYWVQLALLGRIARTQNQRPVLLVRERPGGAYGQLAHDSAAFKTCLDAIYSLDGVSSHLSASRLRTLRSRSEAEMAWVVGRELLRHRDPVAGWRWLLRSVAMAPRVRRAAMLIGAIGAPILPPRWRGPLRPYASGIESSGAAAPPWP